MPRTVSVLFFWLVIVIIPAVTFVLLVIKLIAKFIAQRESSFLEILTKVGGSVVLFLALPVFVTAIVQLTLPEDGGQMVISGKPVLLLIMLLALAQGLIGGWLAQPKERVLRGIFILLGLSLTLGTGYFQITHAPEYELIRQDVYPVEKERVYVVYFLSAFFVWLGVRNASKES